MVPSENQLNHNVGHSPTPTSSFEEDWIMAADKILFTPTALVLAIVISVLLTLAVVAVVSSWLFFRYRERFISVLVRFSAGSDGRYNSAAQDEMSVVVESPHEVVSEVDIHPPFETHDRRSKVVELAERKPESIDESSSLLGNRLGSGSNYLETGKKGGGFADSTPTRNSSSFRGRTFEKPTVQTSYGTVETDDHHEPRWKTERASGHHGQVVANVLMHSSVTPSPSSHTGKISMSKHAVESASQHSSLSTKSPISVFEPRGSTDRAALRHTNSSRYEIISRIGRGAFSCVYLVHRRSDASPFALKYLSCCSDNERLAAVRECELLTRLQGHENIIRILDVILKTELVEEEEEEEEDGNNKASQINILQQKAQPMLDLEGRTSPHPPSNSSSHNKNRHSNTNALIPDAATGTAVETPAAYSNGFCSPFFQPLVGNVEATYAPSHRKEVTPITTPRPAKGTVQFGTHSRVSTPVPVLSAPTQAPSMRSVSHPTPCGNGTLPALVTKQETSAYYRRIPKLPGSSSSSSTRSMQLTPFLSRPMGVSAGSHIVTPAPLCLGPSVMCSSVTSTNSTNLSRHVRAKKETMSVGKSSLRSSHIAEVSLSQKNIHEEHSSPFSSESDEEPLQPVFVGEKPLYRAFPLSELVTRGQVDTPEPFLPTPSAHLVHSIQCENVCQKEAADESRISQHVEEEKRDRSHNMITKHASGAEAGVLTLEQCHFHSPLDREKESKSFFPAPSFSSTTVEKKEAWREPWQPVRVRESENSVPSTQSSYNVFVPDAISSVEKVLTSVSGAVQQTRIPNQEVEDTKTSTSFVDEERKVPEVDPFLSPPVLRSVAYHRCPATLSNTAASSPSHNILSEGLRNREREVSPSYVHHYTTTELLEIQDSKQKNVLSRSLTSNPNTKAPSAVRTASTESPHHFEVHFHAENSARNTLGQETRNAPEVSDLSASANNGNSALPPSSASMLNEEGTTTTVSCSLPVNPYLRSPTNLDFASPTVKTDACASYLPTSSANGSQFTTQDTTGISRVLSSSSLQASLQTEDKDLLGTSGTSPSYITPSTPTSMMKDSGTVLPVAHLTTEQLIAIQEKKQEQQQQHSKNHNVHLLRQATQSLSSLKSGSKPIQYYRDPSTSIRFISSTVGTAVIPRSTPWRAGASYAPASPPFKGAMNGQENPLQGNTLPHSAIRNSNSYFYMRQPAHSRAEMIPMNSPLPTSNPQQFPDIHRLRDGDKSAKTTTATPQGNNTLPEKGNAIMMETKTDLEDNDSSRSHLVIHSPPHSLANQSVASTKTDVDTGMSTANWSATNNTHPPSAPPVPPPRFLVKGTIVGESDHDDDAPLVQQAQLREVPNGPEENNGPNVSRIVAQSPKNDGSLLNKFHIAAKAVDAMNTAPCVPSTTFYSQGSGQTGGIKTTTTRRCRKAKGYLCLIMDYHPMGDLCHYVQQQELRLQRLQRNTSASATVLTNNKDPNESYGDSTSEQRSSALHEKHFHSSLNSSSAAGGGVLSPMCNTSSSPLLLSSLIGTSPANVMAVTESQILSIAYQVASALEVLHSHDPPIVHRDLKPENILIKGEKKELCGLCSATMSVSVVDHQTPRAAQNPSSSSSQLSPSFASTGSQQQVHSGGNCKGGHAAITASYIPIVISDFGLAVQMERKGDGAFSPAHRGGGTKPYMAPEVFTEGAIPASDIWSLGCMLYAIATGRLDRRSVKFMYREVQREDGFAAMILNDILKKRYSLSFATFVVSLLVVDPKKRPSASRIKSYFLKKEKEVSFDFSSPFFSNVLDL